MESTTRKVPRINNRKRYIFNIFLLSISSLLCLLCAELCIRLFLPQKLITQYSKIWRPDNLYGWRHKENIATIINSGEGDVHFVTDNDGYRINAVNENIENNHIKKEYSILFIGDSFLEAIQVENRFTIPQVTKKTLIQYHDVNISVTNAGVGGWDPNHYYLEAQHLSHERYDLAIIFLYVANDIICKKVQKFSPKQIYAHRFKIPKHLTFQEIKYAILYPLNETLECHSHLYVLIKNRTKWLRMKLGLSAYYFPNIFSTKMQSSVCWETTVEVCKSIHDEFSSNGIPCFFVLLPSDYQIDTRIFNSYMKSFKIDATSVDLEQPNKILRRLFESSSLLLVDPLDNMREKAKTGINMYGYIDSHLNADGHKVVAEYIVPIIRTMLFANKETGKAYK